MRTYEFTLVLKGSPELTEGVADRLFEAGCDDGTPGTCNGVFSIAFHRAAETLEGALGPAIRDVKSAGFEVDRIEIRGDSIPIYALYETSERSAYQFSIYELLSGTALVAIGFTWPVLMPVAAALILMRVGFDLGKAVLITLLGFPIFVWLMRLLPW